jgi:tRNA1(Val) A37 N6-methylase TrmN6
MSIPRSTDHFLDHGFAVQQFRDGGHRSGLDAIMLAASVPTNAEGRVADLGAGAGVVGMAIAHRCRLTKVDLVEIDEKLAALSRDSLEMPQNRHLSDRVCSHCADVAVAGSMFIDAQLAEGGHDYIVANPPFNDASHRPSPDADRALAHMADASMANQWVKMAARLARGRARLALIVRPQNLVDYLLPVQLRFGDIKLLPLHPKADKPASRVLIGGTNGSRGAMQWLPPLIIHRKDGEFTQEAENVLRGRRQIDLFA